MLPSGELHGLASYFLSLNPCKAVVALREPITLHEVKSTAYRYSVCQFELFSPRVSPYVSNPGKERSSKMHIVDSQQILAECALMLGFPWKQTLWEYSAVQGE